MSTRKGIYIYVTPAQKMTVASFHLYDVDATVGTAPYLFRQVLRYALVYALGDARSCRRRKAKDGAPRGQKGLLAATIWRSLKA